MKAESKRSQLAGSAPIQAAHGMLRSARLQSWGFLVRVTPVQGTPKKSMIVQSHHPVLWSPLAMSNPRKLSATLYPSHTSKVTHSSTIVGTGFTLQLRTPIMGKVGCVGILAFVQA